MLKVVSTFGAIALCLVASTVDASTLRGVIPVAGSTLGAFGSNFRTSLQLSNRTDRVQSGSLVFHAAGAKGSSSDPTLPYTLQPFETVSYDDVVAALGASGLGSIDLVVDVGGVPALVARAYDDKMDLGTVGAGIGLVATADALAKDDSATLLAPRDFTRFRFNVGIRTLDEGATIMVKVYDANGLVQSEVGPLAFDSNYFVQKPAADFLGTTLQASDSIAISVVNGSAILYGTVTDNTTNDPSIHIATRE